MEKRTATEDLFETIVKEEEISLDFGFYWENLDQIIAQVRSECLEVKEAFEKEPVDRAHLKEEIGDLIHATISLCVYCGCDPLKSLKISTSKYQTRLKKVIHFAKQDGLENLRNQSFKTLMNYWDRAKLEIKKENESSKV